ncbi:hypothetical protein MFIFM68171_01703 [Madurella fahalii]|uniref:Mesaconyl-C4 CoA hydratase n=1 Tax=Madurella fahalii TaxID=1157608 RepID=A0ABQ0G162_9PEZI
MAAPRARPPAAVHAAQQFLACAPHSPHRRRQTLDANQLQKLSLTLGRRELHPGRDVSRGPPPPATPLPPGYHLVYFTPSQAEAALAPDGTDTLFNAPRPFTRRMWAGGRVRWVDGGKGTRLRVGDEVEEVTRVVGAEGKRGRDGAGMVVVEVEKEFRVVTSNGGGSGGKGTAVVDRRSWIFRPPVEAAVGVNVNRDIGLDTAAPRRHDKSRLWDVPAAESPSGFLERHMSWSPVALFGFSALTFNAHKIHYNESWTRDVEGHPDVVVHGPLNLINMLDYWRDVHGRDGLRLKEITYRATAPVYAQEPYRIITSAVKGGEEPRYELLVKKGDVVCMKGEIVARRD